MDELARALGDPAVFRVGLALVHFVWQGAALALLALLVLLSLQRARPGARYIALLVVLAAMAASPIVTLRLLSHASQLRQAPRPTTALLAAARTQPAALVPPHSSPTAEGGEQTSSAMQREPLVRAARLRLLGAWGWVLTHASWATLAWAVGVCLLSCRLLLRWWAAIRGARQATPLREERWQRALAALAERVRVKRAVRLLKSALVSAPAAMGAIRPAILLPVSVLSGLTPEQLEALLAHELAHIRRHDYLINLVQSVIEVLLFYHPAVWWVSHRIRVEREHCCDDVAVGACGSVLTYSRALTELERLRTPMLELVVAASGTPLLARIRRLVVHQDPRGVVPSWIAAIAPVLAVGALIAGPRFASRASGPQPALVAPTLVQPRAAPVGEFLVCNARGDQEDPDVSGDIIVWTDYRNDADGRAGRSPDNPDIYGYDLRNRREFVICAAPGVQRLPAVDGGIVVWMDFRNDPDGRMTWDGSDNPDIYGYDLTTGREFAVCLAPSLQCTPDISRDLVVWEDYRAWPVSLMDIWGCSLKDGQEFAICVSRGDQILPAVSGTLVVWEDYRDDPDRQPTEHQLNHPDVYGRDLAGGSEFPICTHYSAQIEPAVSGRRVVWTDNRSDPARDARQDGAANSDIYACDLAQRQEFSVSTTRATQHWPAIWGDRVVYVDVSPERGSSLAIRNLRTGEDIYLSLVEPYQPAVAGDILVWQDHRDMAKAGSDIYGYRLP